MSKRYASGRKALRQNVVRRLKNREERSAIRTYVKKATKALEAGKKEECQAAYAAMASALDKGVKHGLVHKNTAARKKSRIARKIQAIQ